MQETFFAASHAIDPADKNSQWAARIMYEYYYFGNGKSLLADKDPQAIRDYVNGKQSVDKFKKMFRKASSSAATPGSDKPVGGRPNKDLAGIDWEPLALLTQPFNSALATLQKMPIYVKVTAIDAAAREKKDKDRNFLRNRPFLDAHLAAFGDMMGVKIQPPAAPNNDSGVDISAVDLNPQQEDELNFYMDMFYKLRPETAFEGVLQALAHIYELRKVRDLEDRDQLFYGVSCDRAYFSDITKLPTVRYVYPGNVYTPQSDLPDFSDCDFRYVSQSYTANEVMDLIGSELTKEQVVDIFDKDWELCGREGKWSALPEGRERSNYRINMCYFEFKSPDALSFHSKKKSNGNYIHEQVPYNYELRFSAHHPDPMLRGKAKDPSPDEYLQTKWAQSTYCGYFFPCWCEDVFKYKKLECAHREPGREYTSPFSINIWKSQEKGAAELCIPLVDSAQKAVYKMQHAIIMSRPKGMFVDAKYLRQAVNNLVSTDMRLTMQDVFTMLIDQNIFLGDSEGIDPLELQSGARPYYEIPGGITNEVDGYLAVINDCIVKIQRITGFNDQLTGQTPTQEQLVGIQKLMLQSSINSFYYASCAQKEQTEKVFKAWAAMVQYILKNRNSAAAKALEAILSTYKIDVIRDMDEIPLHMFGTMVENTPTEEQQQELNMMLFEGYQQQRITGSDWVTLKRVFNYKDAAQLFAIRERKQRERAVAMAQQQQQAALQQRNEEMQGQLAQTNMKVKGGIQEEAMRGQSAAQLTQLNAQVQAALQQMQGQMKIGQQRERIAGQLQKVDRTNEAHNQQPLFPAA